MSSRNATVTPLRNVNTMKITPKQQQRILLVMNIIAIIAVIIVYGLLFLHFAGVLK